MGGARSLQRPPMYVGCAERRSSPPGRCGLQGFAAPWKAESAVGCPRRPWPAWTSHLAEGPRTRRPDVTGDVPDGWPMWIDGWGSGLSGIRICGWCPVNWQGLNPAAITWSNIRHELLTANNLMQGGPGALFRSLRYCFPDRPTRCQMRWTAAALSPSSASRLASRSRSSRPSARLSRAKMGEWRPTKRRSGTK